MHHFNLDQLLRYGLVSLFTLHLTIASSATFSSLAPPISPSQQAWDLPTDYPKGKLASYRFKSRLLKNKRDIWIYLPPSYQKKAAPYPLLIVFDGQAYTSQLIPGPTILDNLIGLGIIPPLVALFVSSMGQRERNLELPCYAPFIDSLIEELLPWLHQHYHVTYDPSQIIVAGSSYGGLAAAYAALRYPYQFGNVLSQSGAFWWQPPLISGPWLVKQYAAQPPLPIRFYLDVGNQETESWGGKMSMVQVNHLFRDLLLTKGYQVTYHEFQGGHDYDCWRKTLAIGLIALMRSH
jgi:enterochelin esterase family protein